MVRNQNPGIYVTAALLLVLVCALAGCAGGGVKAMEQRVREMLECDRTGDVEGSFALLYPGVTDEETHRDTFQQIQAYFPITEAYTLSTEQYYVTRQFGARSRTIETARYRVEFDGQVFYILAEYVSEKNSSGFTSFRIVSEADMNGTV
ncbi:MAG: hypothetical protein J6Z23_03785 [Lachnospiraceae bacterium]|nr:hypothetical protein [Lachnospiraceae bacterium]